MNAIKIMEEILERELSNKEKNLVLYAYAIGKADEAEKHSGLIKKIVEDEFYSSETKVEIDRNLYEILVNKTD